MQAPCPSCSYKIVIDDARVPDRPFSVKCPKCQNTVKFPGKSAAAAPAEPAAASPAPPAPPAPDTFDAEEMKAQMMAKLRREMGAAGGDVSHSGERALVALPAAQAGNVALMLTRLGYGVDTVDDADEAARFLDLGVCSVVVVAPVAGAAGKESAYQRACRLNAEARRRIFLVVVADNVKTGDGTQAFVLQSDLVIATKDTTNADVVFRNVLQERKRIYQAFLDARYRADKEAGYI
jgi:predicted Zn finger-like uncharacterized protein